MGYLKNSKQMLAGKLYSMVCLLFVLSSLCGCGKTAATMAENKETVRILSEFTTITQVEDGIYEMGYEAGDAGECDWVIRCTSENNSLRIYDYEACRIFIDYHVDAFKDYYFGYDFDEKRASFHFDEDTYGASIVSYMIDDDEFVLNANGEHYEASEEFESYLRNSGLIDIIKYDIEAIKEQLGGYGISYADVNAISIGDLADY